LTIADWIPVQNESDSDAVNGGEDSVRRER